MYFLRTHLLSFTPSIFAISAILLGDLQKSKTFSCGVMIFVWSCISLWLGVKSSLLGVLLGVDESSAWGADVVTLPVSACLNHIVRLTNGGTTFISGARSPFSLQLDYITLNVPPVALSIIPPQKRSLSIWQSYDYFWFFLLTESPVLWILYGHPLASSVTVFFNTSRYWCV